MSYARPAVRRMEGHYAPLHMWMQVVGKVALAQAAPVNHSWAIAMQVTPRAVNRWQIENTDGSANSADLAVPVALR